jgi:arylsulfatase A-like enzyme
MSRWMSCLVAGVTALLGATALTAQPVPAQAQEKPPNILVIMGDDVGWFNIGAYHRGIMSGKTPKLDTLACQGMMFTDYYAEASCTAGRANFIMGELPIRTGMTTVGQAAADVGIPEQAVTLATVLKSQGYETGQFGKNHLGEPSQGHDRHPTDAGEGRPLLSAETRAALEPQRRCQIAGSAFATSEKEDNVAEPRDRPGHFHQPLECEQDHSGCRHSIMNVTNSKRRHDCRRSGRRPDVGLLDQT